MRRAFPLVLVALLPLAFVAGGGGSGQAAQGSPPSPPAVATDAAALPAVLRVDTRKREESRAFYRAIYASSEGVASGFNGNVDAGQAGTTSREFRDAIARRLNYFRAMAGVPADVTFDDELNRRAQLAALMMSANGQLSHVPPKTWRHYSDDGAQAAGKSNLNLADGPGAIDGYIEDFGDNNGFAGHRRWALYSAAGVMGTGDVDAQGKNRAANALYTVNSSAFRAKPALREAFVAWPPPGFVPTPLVYPRWSFGIASGSLENAVVTMTNAAGAAVQVRVEARRTGFGDDAIVWVPDGWDANSGARPAFTGDTSFHVVVDKVVVAGASKRFEYDVTLFDPAVAGADAIAPTVRGPASPLVGTASAYAFDAVPGADGYVWEDAPLASLALDDGAETGAGGFEVATSPGYAVVSADYAASGTSAFHLAMPDPARQRLTLKRAFLCSAATTLSFQSRLRLATASQRPHVQVAIDGGSTWSDVWARPLPAGAPGATGTADEAAFTKVQVALGAYAGKVVRVRFVYENTGNGQYFPQTSRAGWYFDDVRVAAAEEPLAGVSHSVSSPRFDFAARAPGRTALRVRSRHYGRYLLDWGPVTIVEARGSGAPPPPTWPTATATSIPTATAKPTATATTPPTATATAKPTATSPFPFPLPTAFPTALPTSMPTSMPTTMPTGLPIPIPIPSIFRVPPPPWPT